MKSDFQRELDEIFSDLDPTLEADAHLALDIASQFTALRLRRGLTQGQLADKLGKSQQAISKIENPSHGGHNLARLKEAVEALDATLDVTLVPREDLDAYRAEFVAKPALDRRVALEASSANGSDVWSANGNRQVHHRDEEAGTGAAGSVGPRNEAEIEAQRATNERRAALGRTGGADEANRVRRR